MIRRLGVLAAAVMVAAAGCTPQRQPSADRVSWPPAPSLTLDTEDGPGPVVSIPAPQAAVDAMLNFVRVWARPATPQTQWYAEVRDLTTPAYGRLLATTDPAHVPAHYLTGEPVVRTATTQAITAEVPTDAGIVRITVVPAGDGKWLVASLIGIGLR